MTTRAPVPDAEKKIETWELAQGNQGTCWVWVYDRREDKYTKQRVGGRQGGSRTLHISTDDRRFNQEQIVEEMKDHDPFTNGLLILTSKDHPDDIDTTYHLTMDDLKAIFQLDDNAVFEAEVQATTSELVLRRMLSVAEAVGTVAQLAFVKDLIDERFKVGGTQRSVREMIAAGEDLAGTNIS